MPHRLKITHPEDHRSRIGQRLPGETSEVEPRIIASRLDVQTGEHDRFERYVP